MPLVIFILLILLVAQIGFWNTLAATLGAIGVIALLVVLTAAFAACLVVYMTRRLRPR